MHLFLVVCFPATYGVLRARATAREAEGDLKWLLIGVAAALPAALVDWAAGTLTGALRPFPLYLQTAFADYVALHVFSVGAWLLIRGYRSLENEAGRRRWFDYLAFATGLNAAVAVFTMVTLWGEATLYSVLLLPAARLAVVLATSVLVVLYFEAYGIYKVLYGLAVLILPFASGAVAYLDAINRHGSAGAVLAGLLAVSAYLWHEREGF
jgi:hypothetical protein